MLVQLSPFRCQHDAVSEIDLDVDNMPCSLSMLDECITTLFLHASSSIEIYISHVSLPTSSV
jgi:hypothetical protein